MIKVSNGKYIRSLGRKALKAAKTRNIIAVIAIALTTVLFTSLFTIAISINEGIQQNNFRQVGGFAHGTFKYLSEEEYGQLRTDPLIKEWGLRRVAGIPMEAPFHKNHVEIGYSDKNNAHWSFCDPIKGNLPVENTMEAATDLVVLELLGVEPEIGNEFTLTFLVDGKETTQTFSLCGWWEYDQASPAHQILIPESRLERILEEVGVNPESSVDGYTGSWNLDVMFASSMHIGEDMCKVLANQGYQPMGQSDADNAISFGVNWGYTGAQIFGSMDLMTVIAGSMALLLIILTGYLIIYNIFQISVTNDICFYGLLKTIGTTPKQLKRILRYQAICLSLVGIPAGLVAGWGVGAVLNPIVISELEGVYDVVSVNPLIIVGATFFSLITVLFSVIRPGKVVAEVSPIEAVRYTEGKGNRKKHKKSQKKVSIISLAKANLERNGNKTVITILSMALAVVLLNVTVTFTAGFDMDKYLSARVVTDFVVADAEYFQVGKHFTSEGALPVSVMEDICLQGNVEEGGCVYGANNSVSELVAEEYVRSFYGRRMSQEHVDLRLTQMERAADNRLWQGVQLYGMEQFILEQVKVLEGDITELYIPGSRKIAAVYLEDDYGNSDMDSNWAQIGDSVTLRRTFEWEYYYTDNGEIIEVFGENVTSGTRPWSQRSKTYQDVEYEVAALVSIPNTLSYRYFMYDGFILNAQTFLQDMWSEDVMLYAFNVAEDDTMVMEEFLHDYTENRVTYLDYESKLTFIKEFESMQTMFLVLGSVLSFIVGLVGILNFFNAILTSIMSRKREFAVMQSIGMTGRQLRQMLIWEGVLHAICSVALSLCLVLGLTPIIAPVFEKMFWFFSYRFIIFPVFVVTPVFLLLGVFIPLGVYRTLAKATIVERLREAEN